MSAPWLCLICNREVPDYEPEYCCAELGCSCRGEPVHPCVCSQRCHDALIAGIGKPMEQRRIDAEIEIPDPAEPVEASPKAARR